MTLVSPGHVIFVAWLRHICRVVNINHMTDLSCTLLYLVYDIFDTPISSIFPFKTTDYVALSLETLPYPIKKPKSFAKYTS